MASINNKNLAGLIICGGSSSRMGSDKSLMEYHGISQRIYLFNLLKNFCDNVYLSLNQSQALNADNNFPFIKDDPQFGNIGPMNALLSYWKMYPESSVIAVGCDYPFIDLECFQYLIENRKADATCFINTDENIHEPLITVYESSFQKIISDNFKNNNYSLSKILKQENVTSIVAPSEFKLQNINTPEEFFSAKELINLKTV